MSKKYAEVIVEPSLESWGDGPALRIRFHNAPLCWGCLGDLRRMGDMLGKERVALNKGGGNCRTCGKTVHHFVRCVYTPNDQDTAKRLWRQTEDDHEIIQWLGYAIMEQRKRDAWTR